jgi:hypothetical protein
LSFGQSLLARPESEEALPGLLNGQGSQSSYFSRPEISLGYCEKVDRRMRTLHIDADFGGA